MPTLYLAAFPDRRQARVAAKKVASLGGKGRPVEVILLSSKDMQSLRHGSPGRTKGSDLRRLSQIWLLAKAFPETVELTASAAGALHRMGFANTLADRVSQKLRDGAVVVTVTASGYTPPAWARNPSASRYHRQMRLRPEVFTEPTDIVLKEVLAGVSVLPRGPQPPQPDSPLDRFDFSQYARSAFRQAGGALGRFIDLLKPEPKQHLPSGKQTSAETRSKSEAAASYGGEVIRYLWASLPDQAPPGDEVHLLARIAQHRTSKIVPVTFAGIPAAGAQVTITADPGGLHPLDGVTRQVTVPPDGDSETVMFRMLATQPGLYTVRVCALLAGSVLGDLPQQISVQSGAPQTPPKDGHTDLCMEPEPGEVTLQVMYNDTDRQYRFQFLCGNDPIHPLVERTAGTANSTVQTVSARLNEIALKLPQETTDDMESYIRAAGISFWERLVPDEIKRQFWELHNRIGTFTILSDHDSIPWELLYPKDQTHDEGFLVAQFPVLRRAYGQARPDHLHLLPATFVVPESSPSNAQQEIEAICNILGTSAIAPIDDRAVLEALIEAGDFGTLHFACHNIFDYANGSKIDMRGGEFIPLLMESAKSGKRLVDRSPLVFFNACHTSGEIQWATELMGWASQFVQAGCGAFIGTLWEVRTDSAITYAETFYDAIAVQRKTLSHAAFEARKAIAKPSDPTSLAYSIYGNPGAVVS